MEKCRACGHGLNSLAQFNRVPRDVQHLTTSCSQDITTTDMTVYQCQGCGLVQTDMQLHNNYYDDYLMSQTFSPQLSEYLRDLVSQFVNRFRLSSTDRVLDIGCGDGAFMLPFQDLGIQVHGLEPSQRSGEIARQRGLHVMTGYMTPTTRLEHAPYQAFVTRQVLEHVDDISGLLAGIRANCTHDAVGIIEVPRLEKALQDSRFYDFFPDHVNYFSLDTLEFVLESHGFQVLDLLATMYDEYNVAIVKVRQVHDFTSMIDHRHALTDQLRALAMDPAQKVAMWGAGAKGLSMLSALGKPWIPVLVDSDVNKISRWVPGTNLQVKDPQQLKEQGITSVVISAVAYQNIILSKLRHMQYAGDVYLVTEAGLEKVMLE